MLLSSLLTENTIFVDLHAADKWAAIRHIVTDVSKRHQISESTTNILCDAVIKREQRISTATGHGLAIPHTSTVEIQQALAGLALVPAGLEFEAIDYQPVYIIVLVVVPQHRFKQHIGTIANVAKVMHSQQFRRDLLTSQTATEVLDKIRHREKEVF